VRIIKVAEPIAWLSSIGVHAWLLLPLFIGGDQSPTTSNEVVVMAVAVAAVDDLQLRQSEVEPEEVPVPADPPVELRPVEKPSLVEDGGDTWETTAEEPEGGGVPQENQGATFSDDAVRALNLILDLSKHEQFIIAAQDLGIRFLIYPPSKKPNWVLEVKGIGLDSVAQIDPEDLGTLSRRAHDLTPDRFFRTVRNRATQSVGFSATGARLVAAVPAGTDRMFLAAERAYLQQAGASATDMTALHGRLVQDGGGWRLEITGGR
jgi:hypothetical protein